MEERTLENEVTVDELEENLTGDMEQEQPEEEEPRGGRGDGGDSGGACRVI